MKKDFILTKIRKSIKMSNSVIKRIQKNYFWKIHHSDISNSSFCTLWWKHNLSKLTCFKWILLAPISTSTRRFSKIQSTACSLPIKLKTIWQFLYVIFVFPVNHCWVCLKVKTNLRHSSSSVWPRIFLTLHKSAFSISELFNMNSFSRLIQR